MTAGSQQKAGFDSGSAPHPAVQPGRQVSIDERRRLVAESLRVGNPGNNARELPTQADPRHDCQIELEVDDIRPYENNPRRAGNAKFAEIKESIRSGGIRNPLTVTRRPNDEHFIIEAGGNTRLLAIQQLWAETREERFRKLIVMFRPWRSENHIITSHLIENELRGEMTFWDKATGIVELKVRLEADKGHPLSLRQLEDEMKGLGLSINTATLAHCLFATERLRTLGDAITELSGLDVKLMQPRLNMLKRHAQMRLTMAESELYAMVFEPVFRDAIERYRHSGRFSAADTCLACEEALARQMNQSVGQLRAALHLAGRTSRAAADGPPVAVTSTGSSVPPVVSTTNAMRQISGSPGERSKGSPAGGESAAAHRSFIEQIRTFAELTGIEKCLRVDAVTPLWYRVDALPDPHAGNPQTLTKQRAWWLLALLSGQLVDDVDRSSNSLASPFASDTALLDWLIDPNDATASAFWDVLTRAREVGSFVPDANRSVRHSPPHGDA